MIRLEGDSWAWTFRPMLHGANNTPLKGFGHILARQGYPIQVDAVPGSSNGASIGRLARTEWDRAIWIQTEPVRDFMLSDGVLNYTLVASLAKSHGGLTAAFTHYLADQYRALAQIADGRPVYVLGGCSAIQRSVLPKELTLVVASIPGHFCGGVEQQGLFQNTHNWLDREYADYIRSLDDHQLIEDWFQESRITLAKLDAWRACRPWFAPDYWHVNLGAHKRLAEIVKPYLDK